MCEFITGGGLCAEALPDSLVNEGALMRDALLRDLAELPYKVHTSVDARLQAPQACVQCVRVQESDDVWGIWRQQIRAADAVFLIAPETDGLLHYLTQIAGLEATQILGCGLDSILTTSDKMATYLALKAASIATIDTFNVEHWTQHEAIKANMTWLAKPNDGVGCEATVCFDNAENLMHWLAQNNKQSSPIIQPFQAGTPASVSCVMRKGKAYLLSCNTQKIEINNHQVSYKGGVINGMHEHWQAFEIVANQIAQMLPDLAGYVGIDVIVHGDDVIVVEINPRLTTSYAGLHESIGFNPAELIINTLTQPDFQWPKLQQNMVTISV